MPAITYLSSPDSDDDAGRQLTVEVFPDGSVTVAVVDVETATGGVRTSRWVAAATVDRHELAAAIGADAGDQPRQPVREIVTMLPTPESSPA